MAEELQISSSVSGEQKYIDLIPQLKYLVDDELLLIAIIDVDSDKLGDFSAVDLGGLENASQIISLLFK